jgi:hypothetical protein
MANDDRKLRLTEGSAQLNDRYNQRHVTGN